MDYYNLPKTRKEAKLSGSKYYFSGIPCSRGHLSERRTSNRNCLKCTAYNTAQWKLNNPVKYKESVKKSNKKCRDAFTPEQKIENLKRIKDWTNNNPERFKESKAKWRDKNIERIRSTSKIWASNNRYKLAKKSQDYRSSKLNRTPKWLTEDQKKAISAFYELSIRLEKETGIKHNVDHIIPLQGKNVSGLHVPDNLRVIPASENFKKSNKFTII